MGKEKELKAVLSWALTKMQPNEIETTREKRRNGK